MMRVREKDYVPPAKHTIVSTKNNLSGIFFFLYFSDYFFQTGPYYNPVIKP